MDAAAEEEDGKEDGDSMSDLAKIANLFRAEADRLDATARGFTGWQAVQASLRAMADAIEKAAEGKP